MRESFGSTLKRFRERNGFRFSQSKLAAKAGFDHSYVSRLERGSRQPTREAVERLAVAMQLPDMLRDELRMAAGYVPNDPLVLLGREPEIADALDLLSNPLVPTESRDNLRKVLRVMCDQIRVIPRETSLSAILADQDDLEPQPSPWGEAA